MRYFLDTEFAEKPNTIDLISIGIVCEDGRECYFENFDFDESLANDWVKQNVLPHLWDQKGAGSNPWVRKGVAGGLYSLDSIGKAVMDFVGDDDYPEFWGYYCDYDWVVFCWLFGSMVDLPKGWPMYCKDIKQLCDDRGNPKLPEQESQEHNALEDARWNKKAFYFLDDIKYD